MGTDFFAGKALQESLHQLATGTVHDRDFYGLHAAVTYPVRVALDVGANRGQSIISLKTVFPDAVIHAFEANRLFHSCLTRLAEHYGDSVFIYSYGLGEAETQLQLYVPWVGDEPYLEESSTRLDYFVKPWVVEKFVTRGEMRLEGVIVDLRPGDALALSPDIVKIDVEGAELDVLIGLRNTIQRSKPALLIENSDWHSVTAFLADLGYDPFRWEHDAQRLTPFYGATTNCFYLHRSRLPLVFPDIVATVPGRQ